MLLNYPVIDMHAHFRGDIEGHTWVAKKSGIDAVCYMANSTPPLDSLERIQRSLTVKRHCYAFPVSAITEGLEGKKLVDVGAIKGWVAGFSDDGKYLYDMDLLADILSQDVLVMVHCSPSYERGIKEPWRETEYISDCLGVLARTGGLLHIQHISKAESVELIRKAKADGARVTCETCPHYFSYTRHNLPIKVNPPLGEENDVLAIIDGLADGTIDVIASDYAPEPRVTGIAGFRSFIPLSHWLVLLGALTEKQLREKLFLNPKSILKSGGTDIDFLI